MRIDAGHPDHDDPKLKHVVLQINAKPQNATLKSAIANKRGTHTKVATFALDTTAEITKDLLEAKIFGEK
ncbi:hypothetical protein BD414DRAFT_503320 [Trametes punicea]|nr:hypothetical protein BD414DRAFT_503320 [Trametes punicea]